MRTPASDRAAGALFLCLILALPGCRPERADPAGVVPPPAATPEPIPADAAPPETDFPDYKSIAEELQADLGEDFLVGIEGPYIVAGNLPPERFEEVCQGAIRWAHRHLVKDFFTAPFDGPIRVYLFDGKESYEAYTVRLCGHRPHTPFGFYDDDLDALIMNIGTGTGTLVHEMVHPLLDNDFPSAPAWLNEGMGSLFEQCRSIESDRIVGLTNWRLAGLHESIRIGTLPHLRDLFSTTTSQFYGEDRGDNYAQARYFLYYLQEKRLLRKFYAAFRDRHEEDPTGTKFVEELLEKDIDEIEADWLRFVEPLKFP